MAIKRTAAALLAAAGIAALAVTGATVAAASSTPSPAPSDTEHWIVESTNPLSATATLIARGPLTIGGTINLVTGQVKLPGGTLTLSHHQVHGTQGENARTCLATVTSSGTYKVTGGTGLYRHVTGHGNYSLVAYAIVKKVKGKCSVSVPYAQTELLTATGPLTG
jgi:hypothetical protein